MNVLKEPELQRSAMRIHVADYSEADAAWRMLNAVPDGLFQPVELHLDGYGPLCQVVRAGNGDQSIAPVAAAPVHTHLA
jgi:hypothetical protein